MRIRELSKRTGLSDDTIRYYEAIGVLPSPCRQANGYRDYSEADVERVRFVAGARRLGFSLKDNIEILALRDRREAPCRVVLNLIQQKSDEIKKRIKELRRIDKELRQLHALGLKFPMNDVDGKNCVCHLISEKFQGNNKQVRKRVTR